VLNLELKPASSVKLDVAHKAGLSLGLKPATDATVDLSIGCKLDKTLVLTLAPFYRGPQGLQGDAASISADEPNAIKEGSDNKMLVDDVTKTNCQTDFLVIYQLSK
jgi:hypothetical protein